MATEIRVPTLGESVTEATIGQLVQEAGDAVKADEPLVELETDKVTLEVNAPAAGVLGEITAKDGETVARRRAARPDRGRRRRSRRRRAGRAAAAAAAAAAPAPAETAPAPAAAGSSMPAAPVGRQDRRRERLDPAAVAGSRQARPGAEGRRACRRRRLRRTPRCRRAAPVALRAPSPRRTTPRAKSA